MQPAQSQPVFQPVQSQTYPEAQNDDLVTESISKKSSLNFFKSLIKEGEAQPPKAEMKQREEFKPPKPSSSVFSDTVTFQSSGFEKQWKADEFVEPFHLEPGPPPEMGYIPKTQAPPQKENLSDRVKRLEESQRDLSFSEIPSGGVMIFPRAGRETPQSPMKTPSTPVLERKQSSSLWEGKKEIKEELIMPQRAEPAGLIDSTTGGILRPGADIPLRPSSPRPSAEGVSMEKLWSSKKEESNFSRIENDIISPSPRLGVDRTVSPLPSADGRAMDKLWAHKHQESSLPSVWPPPGIEIGSSTTTSVTERSEFKKSSQFSSVSSSSFSSVLPPMPAHPIPQPVEPPPTGNIIYVAEAHATHRANVNTLSTKSDFFESSQQQSEVVTETNITPAEAKKIWTAPPVESPKPIPKQEFKPVKIPSPAVPVDDGIRLEPGPPPEIAFATPPPAEGVRRQSYVEMMEHEIEKDLDKEPTKRLVGAVRTIPPPPLKRESSVESQKSIHMEKSLITTNKVERRANSFCDESFKSFPVLEPFPFKPEQGSPSPVKCSTLPRPSKFKKQCTESDYESDLEGSRIKPRWTPIHSDTEDPHYRKVKPPSSSGQPKRAQSEQPEAPPPSLYSSPPVTFSTRVTSSSESFMQSKQIQMKSQESRQIKQSESSQQETVQLKPGSPPQYLQTKPESQFQQSKPESPKIKKRPTPTDSGYMADTDEPRISRQKTTSHRIEKSIVQHSTFKQEKKTASSGQYQDTTQQVSSSTFQSLEPFPFKPSVVSEMPSPKVPLASPSKFTKGEFRESDYESDYEKSARIPPIWTPTQSGFKPVVKPQFSPAPAPAFEAPKPKFEPIEKANAGFNRENSKAATPTFLRPETWVATRDAICASSQRCRDFQQYELRRIHRQLPSGRIRTAKDPSD
uniref:Uncharacterized protein n=1 Tax=Lygus hesperus TaxID=30085 RepID=A0A0A9W5X2_LYGHE